MASWSLTQNNDTKEAQSDGEKASIAERFPQVSERKVWLKLDFYLLPVAAMFYFLSFLDRTNIANARLSGLQQDLKMTDRQFTIALTVTYVPYIVTELPSNLILKIVGPNLLLPSLITLWGIVATLQGVVNTYSQLLACRFLLGLFEGGLFPGLVLYLSYFYPRHKMNSRISAFFASASLSGAFSGILAFGISDMAGIGGRGGWSWILILEGLFTFTFGIFSFFALPRSIGKTRFLNENEKAFLRMKLLEENVDNEKENFSWREVFMTFKLPQVWLLSITFFMNGAVIFGLAYFTPSIIQGLGFSSAKAQLISVPPFAVACVFAMAFAIVSDQYHCRGIISIIFSLLCVVGFGMFLGSQSPHIQYGSLFFSITGIYTLAPTSSAWLSNNAAPETRRATAIAVGFMMTNIGGILGTWLLGSLSSPPEYHSATVTFLIFSIACVLLLVLNLWYLWDQNLKKMHKQNGMTQDEEEVGLGDLSAWYIYNL